MNDHCSNMFNENHISLLRDRAKELFELELSDVQLEQFMKYGNLLLEWNERINLTSITDPQEIMIKHFLDSLIFVKYVHYYYEEKDISFADLGTGAGFPGIPVKILLPNIKVVLIDSLAKRLNFLQEVVRELKLQNIVTQHARAEDIGRDKKFREYFDITAARAVAELPVLLEYTIPLLKVGGRLFAAKGVEPQKEIETAKRAMRVLNCETEQLEEYRLAEGADHRSMIVIKKNSHTLPLYPRQAGKPKKSPL